MASPVTIQRFQNEIARDPKVFLLASRVNVFTSGQAAFKAFGLSEPSRVVVDVSAAEVGPAEGRQAVDDGLVQSVRWAKQPGGVVRVVLDLSRPAPFRVNCLDAPPRLVVEVDRLEVTLFDVRAGALRVIPFDDYLRGVLAAEMPASFQEEALKAQAVAARTYTLKRLRAFGGAGCSRHAGADVCSDPAHCQDHMGLEARKALWKEDFPEYEGRLGSAVAATRHQYLTFGGALAEAVYHSTCGGHTASAEEVWGKAVPYLGGVPCEYCQISPRYRETRRLDLADLCGRLGVEGLRVRKTSPSGRAVEVGALGRVMSGNDLRAALGLPSTLVEGLLGEVTLTTGGYGHGVGLCQWGAEGQARKGRGFREILYFYYPGTVVAGESWAASGGSVPPTPGNPDSGAPGGPGPSGPGNGGGGGQLPLVVLDPGHGGDDPGAVGPDGLTEKSVNLDVAAAAAAGLDGKARVLLTRTGDDAVSLRARTDLANANRATVFVSVHANGSVDPKAAGTETYSYPGSTLGALAASALQKQCVAALRRPDRGVKTANFFVLRETECPAALVETLFVTNPKEAALLADPAVRRKAGEAVAAGILDYLARVK